jgi:RNA polymerase sigma factor (sigma-70 family)
VKNSFEGEGTMIADFCQMQQVVTNTLPFPCTPAQAADNRLVERTRKGDTEAFNELVLTYQDAVYRQAYWVLGQKEAAEDAAQEAFILAYQKLDRFKGGSFRAWLLAITTNASIDMLRRNKKHPLFSLDDYEDQEESGSWYRDETSSPEKIVEESSRFTQIQEALLRMPLDSRIAIVLVDIQEMDYQSAAAALRVPLGTLKSRVARARMRLMDLLVD